MNTVILVNLNKNNTVIKHVDHDQEIVVRYDDTFELRRKIDLIVEEHGKEGISFVLALPESSYEAAIVVAKFLLKDCQVHALVPESEHEEHNVFCLS